jgi:hypothetical protein
VFQVIVDLSEYRDERGPRADEQKPMAASGTAAPAEATDNDRRLFTSRLFDLEHHRRLKALHSHLEAGATLSDAARLIGVSHMTAYRWNDHGRR